MRKLISMHPSLALFIIISLFGIIFTGCSEQVETPPPLPTPSVEENIENITEPVYIPPLQYTEYLEQFLSDTGLTSIPSERNGFSYYILNNNENEKAGFVFKAQGDGWGGPINMFVKTDMLGNIKRVYVFDHLETPIYVVDLDNFLNSFMNFRIDTDLVWQKDIHGLAGATLSAEAIIEAVNNVGTQAFEKGIFENP